MRLVARNHCHTTNRRGQFILADDRKLVVVLWNHLLVIGIGPFDESRIDLCTISAKSKMIAALGDFQVLLAFKEALNLLERYRRNNEICAGST